jgi:hypothetical protein
MKNDNEDKGFRLQSAGKFPAVKSIDTVALYDEKSGAVLHLHEIIMFEGAKAKTIEEMQNDALDYAKQLGNNVQKLAALHVPNFQANAPAYKVNLKKKTLEATIIPTKPEEKR